MGPSDLDAVDSSPVAKNIKSLIKLFEEVSKPKNDSLALRRHSLNELKNKNISNALKMVQESQQTSSLTRQSSSCDNELEKCVSVKSIVYNFQKMSEENASQSKTISVQKPSSYSRSYSFSYKDSKQASDESKSDYPLPEKKESSTEQAAPTIIEPADISTTPGKIEVFFTDDENDIFGSDLSGDDSDFSPLNDGITPLPDSYQVVSKNGKKLDLVLPPPPEKSLLKKGPTTKSHNVQFSDVNEITETYNKYEYARALEELDVVGATAEYEFEKMFQRMEKIEFTIHKDPTEKLGLQVCGVSIRSQSARNNMAIYVKSITPGSLCDLSGNLRVDDLIIEINGTSLVGVEVSKVSEAIRAAGSEIKFMIGRDIVGGEG